MYPVHVSCTQYMCHVPSTCVMYPVHVSCTQYMCHVPSTYVMYPVHVSCTQYMCHVPSTCVMYPVHVNIAHLDNNSFKLSQPHLIESIIKDLGLGPDSKSKLTPSVKGEPLHAFQQSPPHCQSWSYRSVLGKLNYLEKCSRPDIVCRSSMCAVLSESQNRTLGRSQANRTILAQFHRQRNHMHSK
jgi:hypothetical protein